MPEQGEDRSVRHGDWWIIPESEYTPGTATIPAGWVPTAWLRRPDLSTFETVPISLPQTYPTKEAADKVIVRIAIEKIDQGTVDEA